MRLGTLMLASVVAIGCGDAATMGELPLSSWSFLDTQQSIRTADDVVRRRGELLDVVFGGPMPTRLPDTVEPVIDSVFEGYAIERISVTTDDLTSIAYLIHPASWNGALAIYHQGHLGDFRIHGVRTIRELLASDYQVLAFAMPMLGMNVHPFEDADHARLAARDHPLRYFADPVVVALNWAGATYAYTRRFMVGISGGGWTTVLLAAIDERIDASYPVAGSWPHYLREAFDTVDDYEQHIIPSYLELYLMATYPGRLQVQFFNELDPCCFAGTAAYDYLGYVSYHAALWGGRFDILIDRGQDQHILSQYTLSEILKVEAPIADSLE